MQLTGILCGVLVNLDLSTPQKKQACYRKRQVGSWIRKLMKTIELFR